MAIPALRRAGGTEHVAHPVNARGVILRFLFVAMRAIGRTQRIVNQVFDIGMTIHAVEIGVNRVRESVRRENQRFGSAIDYARRIWIKMATQTVRIGKLWRSVGRGWFLGWYRDPGEPEKGQQAKPRRPGGSPPENERRAITVCHHDSGLICSHR